MKTNLRLAALRRFAIAITILNILGHFYLGFEQSWAHPLVAILTTYSLDFLFETLFCYLNKKTPRYKGGFGKMVDFLLPAHITALAVSMLLFTNAGLIPIIFASAVAITSKVIFRVKTGQRSRHFLNPSNTGIAITLILFPWIGIAPPYQFTENIVGAPDWIFLGILFLVGSFLNTKYTKKIVLILVWLVGFFMQAFIRSLFFDMSLTAALLPFTGIAFLLFTFYMISDPATTPYSKKGQAFFGLAVATVYGLLMVFHIVFGLFFSLLIVCTLRGAYLWVNELNLKWKSKPRPSDIKSVPRTIFEIDKS